MKNREKYAEEIRNYRGRNFCEEFIKPYILKSDKCTGIDCTRCSMLQMLWLLEEYEEVDWSKVAVDTPILVRNREDDIWEKAHFAKYEEGRVCAWWGGKTSWTIENGDSNWYWNYAKLAEGEDE